jgi:hypothetical protein
MHDCYLQNMDTTPSPAIHNPAYDTNWTPRNEPSNATPMPLAIVTASPTLLWLLGCRRFRFRTNKIEEWSWFYKITYAANLIPLKFFWLGSHLSYPSYFVFSYSSTVGYCLLISHLKFILLLIQCIPQLDFNLNWYSKALCSEIFANQQTLTMAPDNAK